MRFIKTMGAESSPDDWVLWCVLWGCVGMLTGGFVVLIGISL